MARRYELVLLGATGRTGKLAAEHITLHAPTDLSWSIAGRSGDKLNRLASQLQKLNPDRGQPGIELFEVDGPSLQALVLQAEVVVSTIGPFLKYATPIVEACAKHGTHYVDCSAEVPWHREMIERFDAVAKASGAIIIPQTGVGSAPADLTVYFLASYIRKTFDAGTLQVISASEVEVQPSAGSMDAVLSEHDAYGRSQMAECRVPFALSPVVHAPVVKPVHRRGWKGAIGIGYDPQLGALTTFEQSAIDMPLVQRSWGLLDDGKFYGPRFQYEELKPASSIWAALAGHFGFALVMFALSLSPVRWFLRRLAPANEENNEAVNSEFFRSTTIAIADTPQRQRVTAKSGFSGGIYRFTGVCIVEAALTLLRDGETHATKIGGGFLTSATLGSAYIDRLQRVGVQFEIVGES